jgi:hypothetical protein
MKFITHITKEKYPQADDNTKLSFLVFLKKFNEFHAKY